MLAAALKRCPEDADCRALYASLLWRRHHQHDVAERMLQDAVAAAPRNAAVLHHYADFLRRVRKDEAQAEAVTRRAEAASGAKRTKIGTGSTARGQR